MDRIAEMISGLSPAALYALMGLLAFIEAIVPVMPADVLVALLAFVAARQGASEAMTIAVIVGGMSVGSAIVYGVARRFGTAWAHKQLKRFGVDAAERKLEALYGRYGLGALFLGRFIPGLRMLVPPVAGMLRVPFIPAMVLMSAASLIWYGAITILAFQVGEDWEVFRASVERLLSRVGITAAAFLALALLIGWAVWRQRKFKKETKAESEAQG
jgi:membrane protein DedA with SNARE-associated domain